MDSSPLSIPDGQPDRSRIVLGWLDEAGDAAKQIEDVAEYGETLVELPHDTWTTSVAQWLGTRWDVLVDLWTEGEGRSDLVLHARVFEANGGYRYEVHLVYVP